MATLDIPQVTLEVGSETFGPASADDADVNITVTIDRTPDGGLNSLTPDSALSVAVDQSDDRGETWQNLAGASGWTGGEQFDKHHNVRTQEQLFTTLNPGTSRLFRAVVTAAGTAIAIDGSVTTD